MVRLLKRYRLLPGGRGANLITFPAVFCVSERRSERPPAECCESAVLSAPVVKAEEMMEEFAERVRSRGGGLGAEEE